MRGGGTGQSKPVDDIYRVIREAVESRSPMAVVYRNRRRLLCPHKLGRNKEGQLRVLCYQYGGESQSGLMPAGSPANWRCMALDKLSSLEVLGDVWRTAPNHSRPTSCIVTTDVDADDYPEREPQKGQCGSASSR